MPSSAESRRLGGVAQCTKARARSHWQPQPSLSTALPLAGPVPRLPAEEARRKKSMDLEPEEGAGEDAANGQHGSHTRE
jgi:hypothetical protein